MIFTIENEFISVSVSDLGAEIISVKSKYDNFEYIWQADPKYWQGHSPVIFPICGRLYGGKYIYNKNEYELGCHGFARHSFFTLVSASASSVTLSLKGDDTTKQVYPFNFIFSVTYSLDEKSLTVSYNVKNTDTKEIIFALGGHPAFNVPMDNGNFEDYYVEFDKKCDAYRVDFSDTCFLTENDKPYMAGGTKKINLSHGLFDNDAIFLYNTDKKITLSSPKTEKSVKLSFKNFKYIGLWHKPHTDAPYICIEPWMSVPSTDKIVDSLNTKKDMIHLPASYSFKNSYSIEFE